jgi:hypothetical protein
MGQQQGNNRVIVPVALAILPQLRPALHGCREKKVFTPEGAISPHYTMLQCGKRSATWPLI